MSLFIIVAALIAFGASEVPLQVPVAIGFALVIVVGHIIGVVHDIRANREWERREKELDAFAREHPDFPRPRMDRVWK